jgi:hypothetical protein
MSFRVAFIVGFALALSCGDLADLPDDIPKGPACRSDAECVPNACCGEGTGISHESAAPSCSNVSCNNQCDPSKIECGCGLPVCRDGYCAVAWSGEARCAEFASAAVAPIGAMSSSSP